MTLGDGPKMLPIGVNWYTIGWIKPYFMTFYWPYHMTVSRPHYQPVSHSSWVNMEIIDLDHIIWSIYFIPRKAYEINYSEYHEETQVEH